MSWKEREAEIRQAVSALRKQQARISKKGARIHDETMAERVARLRALENSETCGGCQGLKIEIEEKGRPGGVKLRCQLGGSPLDLHRLEKTPLGEVPECKFRIPLEE
ncbi:hypothetical protein COU95_01950 [Candidatus Shapirobacteria bacterium CG10_big_fil_rev_8_21_14_0_10_40_9]|uniref:Uncharacterized protein n=1 Tax=Candidatus Shapirobacteria bacterium CG10_big_fil_rev_8_21_14_0_10_40_9 TaxID=1974888 RepID=A0A2M8L3M9_9BACT|nr:MAG: hypothetical protein COU95_01950 [Candidatus Shapirobacteria bacterium CG10_big_fil_rev_8_21_14_0_10_40_9]